jgi:hypothetical protein
MITIKEKSIRSELVKLVLQDTIEKNLFEDATLLKKVLKKSFKKHLSTYFLSRNTALKIKDNGDSALLLFQQFHDLYEFSAKVIEDFGNTTLDFEVKSVNQSKIIQILK